MSAYHPLLRAGRSIKLATFTYPAGSRGLISTPVLSSQRMNELNRLRKIVGYADKKVNTKKLLDGLRSLQSERALTNNRDIKPTLFHSPSFKKESMFYRDGYRDIVQLSMGVWDEQLERLNGVTWRAISNLVHTGSIPEVEAFTPEMRSMIEFHRVHGLGDKKARDLVEQGYTSLKDLQTWPSLTKAMRIGLDHLEDMETLIPRQEIEIFKDLLTDALKGASPAPEIEITGSFRRGEKVCSDIDLAVWHPDCTDQPGDAVTSKQLLMNVMAALAKAGLLDMSKVLAAGDKKMMGITRLPDRKDALWRRLDIRVCPFGAHSYFLLGNTGDDNLMKILRAQAKTRGWTLNEYGMGQKQAAATSTWFVEGTKIAANSEEEIFAHLGVPYLAPTDRSFKKYSKILPPRFLVA